MAGHRAFRRLAFEIRMARSYGRVMKMFWEGLLADSKAREETTAAECQRLRDLLTRAVRALDETEDLESADLAQELAAAGSIPLQPS